MQIETNTTTFLLIIILHYAHHITMQINNCYCVADIFNK